MKRFALCLTALTFATVVMDFNWTGEGDRPAIVASQTSMASLTSRATQGALSLLSPAAAEAAEAKKVSKKAVKKKPAVMTAAAKSKNSQLSPSKKVAAKRKDKKGIATKKAPTTAKATVAEQSKTTKQRTVKKSSGRCEPQSLTYARQRSGIMRSRNGVENGPLTWFASEKQNGMTSDQPVSGSVLILGADKGHGMPTGHVAFVEQAHPSGSSRYKVIFSHTNYDRKCSLETNIEAVYDSAAKTLDIYSGAWQPWGRGLRVAGFIEQK